ncbi:MAG: FG-GAP-like repeat-containing protein [Planctomycetota bacterium]
MAPSNPRGRFLLLIVAAALAAGGVYWFFTKNQGASNNTESRPAPPSAKAAILARHRILASVHYINSRLEDPKSREEIIRAVEEADECVQLAPGSPVDQLNLAICYLRQFDERRYESGSKNSAGNQQSQPESDWISKAKPLLTNAITILNRVQAESPRLAPAQFHAAMAEVRRGKLEAAEENSDWKLKFTEAANKYIEIEDRSSAVRYHYGMLEFRSGKYKEAEASLRRAVELDPNHPNAYWTLGHSILRQQDANKSAEVPRIFETHRNLQETVGKARAEWDPDAVFDFIYPELIPVEGNAPESPVEGAVRFVKIKTPFRANLTISMLLGDAAVLPDSLAQGGNRNEVARVSLLAFEADGKSAFWNISDKNVINAKERGPEKLTNTVVCATQGDFDGDHALDLIMSDGKKLSWLRPKGLTPDAGFENVILPGLDNSADIVSLFAADLDSDGDLDLVAGQNTAPGSRIRIYRNDAEPVAAPEQTPAENLLFKPKFTDISDQTNLSVAGWAACVRPLDFDRGNDTDILLVNETASAVFANRRNLKFDKIAALPGGEDGATGDIDGDGFTDVAIAGRAGLYFVKSTGTAFETRELLRGPLDSARVAIVDLENRGWLDIVCVSKDKIRVLRYIGGGKFTDVGPRLFQSGFSGEPQSLTFCDLDGDFDLDAVIATKTGESIIYINEGGEKSPATAITFRGTKTNRAGIGSKIEARAAGFRTLREVWSLPAYVAAGPRPRIDGLFIKWTNGIDEAEGAIATGRYKNFLEKRGREGSCPFVYSWDGEKFVFISDALGATPLGLFAAPGIYVPPQDREWLRIRSDQLKPKDGKYEIRFTEEMREATYLDQVTLICIDHPAGTTVYPDEKFTFPPFTQKRTLRVSKEIPIRSAKNNKGEDITKLLAAEDRLFTKPAERLGYQGMCAEHSMELGLGKVDTTKPVRLFLTGWFAWTNSSINKAIAEAGIRFSPPRIDKLTKDGWKTIVPDAGFPAGMQKTICIDLSGKLDSGEQTVRIVTNLALYWDRAFLSFDDDTKPDGASPFQIRTTEIAATAAELRWRGAARWERVDGKWPTEPIYSDVAPHAVYDLHSGDYTKYGGVLELLQKEDNQYAIFHHGDEVAITFDASAAPPPAAGMERTFFLNSSGWAKDMDINTFAPGTLEPLPFHGMTGYPYTNKESYPTTPEIVNYRKTWNTRSVKTSRTLPIRAGIEALHKD